MPRIAVLNGEKCQPKRCSLECIKYCPGVRTGDETIVIGEEDHSPRISEELCTGCGICVHKCPFEAIAIINLPERLEGRCIHRYGPNGFALYELPIPREGKVTGLVGPNGIGKTTALSILAGELRPNLGREDAAGARALGDFFKGSELQVYFGGLDEIKISYKPQAVARLPRVVGGEVGPLLKKVDERGVVDELVKNLNLSEILDREASSLSGGELQRLAIAGALAKEADVYYFDEPSSHLDIYQRLNAAKVIQRLAGEGKSVLVVEHDLAALDYMCDYVHVVYGEPGAYGVISELRGVRVGINVFLNGYLREENVRFRKEPIRFDVRPPAKAQAGGRYLFEYPRLIKRFDGFALEAEQGAVYRGEVVGVVGPNATGKTTFVRMLTGEIEPTEGKIESELTMAHKPQYPQAEFEGTVGEWLRKTVSKFDRTFKLEVLKPLGADRLIDREFSSLSGGELQRVAVAGCLGKAADLYLLDEPSAYLDVEQRLGLAKAIRRIIEGREAAASVVDHDVLVIDYMADRLLVFGGKPGRACRARSLLEMRDGMNMFLHEVGVTFRRDPQTGRPRANKPGSQLDQEQKERGEFYYLS